MSKHGSLLVHAGAHRTGTSSFQLFLDANAAVLRAHGYATAYPARDGVPGGRLRLRLPSPRHDDVQRFVPGVARLLRRRMADAPFLILSEENLPGRMLHFSEGRFFPARDKRLSVLAAALPGPVAHLVYVVRPYDDVFVSAFRRRAQDRAVPAFADVKPAMLGFAGGWVDTVVSLRDHLRPQRLTVIDYGARGSNAALLSQLAPDAAALPLEEPETALNISATDAVLQALQARLHDGQTLSAAQVRAVMRRHAKDQGARGFAAFSAAEHAHLRARYCQDLDRLSRLSDVRLVRDMPEGLKKAS